MTNSAYYATCTIAWAAAHVLRCLSHHSPWNWPLAITSLAFTLLVMTALRGVLNPKKIKR